MKIVTESFVGMLQIPTVLLGGLRVSRCLCSHETCWGQLWIASCPAGELG